MVDTLLRFAYGANIVILVPVVWALVAAGSPAAVFGPGVNESPGLRLLVVSLWGAILACSVLGMFAPRAFVAILLLQVIYKAAWLIAYVLPTWRNGEAVPWGPAVTFAAIVLIWPIILVLAYRRIAG